MTSDARPTKDARDDIEPFMYVAGFLEPEVSFNQRVPWSKASSEQKAAAHRKAIDAIRARFNGPITEKLVQNHCKIIGELGGVVGPCCAFCDRNYWESCRSWCVGGYVNDRWPKPMNDWVLVRMDPLPEKSGSIFLPNKGRIYTATVLAVGPGTEVSIDHRTPEKKCFVHPDVRAGEKIAFLRWAIESQQGKAVSSSFEELGADLALIKERDILFALELEPGEKVELSL